MNLLVFFDFEPKKFFRVPSLWGLYGAERDERLCSLCTFQPFLLCWPVHNLLMQFFTLDSSKIEVFETFFFDIVTT